MHFVYSFRTKTLRQQDYCHIDDRGDVCQITAYFVAAPNSRQ